MNHPTIIQGGMGVAVSGWRLASTVSRAGELGVVSGTSLETVFIRRLQDGDEGGHLRRAMAHFPLPGVAEKVAERYFVPGGKDPEVPYLLCPKATVPLREDHQLLLVLANFVEVFLAKEGHDGRVGINYLEKVRTPHLPSLYGAMLAGVDYVLMGAGIPREIPGVLDAYAENRMATIDLPVEGGEDRDSVALELDPAQLPGGGGGRLERPFFLAIVSSYALAKSLTRRATGRVDGFVIEGPSAGGHNAPPRGRLQLDSRGEPIYGPRDEVDLEPFVELGRPFWIAGSCADARVREEVLALGGNGIQVGTAFALSRESGLTEEIRSSLLREVAAGEPDVRVDARASPTGFPFRIFRLQGTLAHDEVYDQRRRVCDLGYLRSAYRRDDGRIGFRCSAEPESGFLRKGGAEEELAGRRCLCNALMANIGLAQQRKGSEPELPLITSGADFTLVRRCLAKGGDSYSALDVLDALREATGELPVAQAGHGGTA